jgi:membrane-bound serine protease (ClpP class)
VLVVAPMAVVVGVVSVLAGRLAVQARGRPSTLTGTGRFLGRDLTVDRTDGTTGQAFIEGAWWRVRSAGGPLVAGARARVTALDGLELVVEPHPPPDVTSQGKEAP